LGVAMSLKTTFLLLLLVAVGIALALVGPSLGPWLELSPKPDATASDDTQSLLKDQLTPAKLTRIEVHKGEKKMVLERNGDDWTLPGKWPTRKREVEELVNLIGGLQSRFSPIAVAVDDLATYGLEKPAATVLVWAGDEKYTLAFGEGKAAGEDKASEKNRFTRPTYLQVDERMRVLHLAPGILAILDRPVDYYQQRRLFIDSERIAKQDGADEKVERLAAQSVAAEDYKDGGNGFTLKKTGDDWELHIQQARDHVDPEKLNEVLTAIPDVWAEQFVEKPKADLAEYGLKEPEQTITVTRPNGDVVVLQIGKKSDTKKPRTITRAPPPGIPGAEPMTTTVTDEFRYAKLQNNSQIFEIRVDKLKDIFVAAKDLRDPRLARFEAKDVTRLEVKQNGVEIVLVKEPEKEKEKKPPSPFPEPEVSKWRLEKPIQADAESAKVMELLTGLSHLEARDPDILDGKDAKTYGLADPAATAEVKIVVEQEVKGADDAKKQKEQTFTFRLGKQDGDKLYVQVQGVERINVLKNQEHLASLATRAALAYRGRRVFDFSDSGVDSFEIERPGEKITLKQDKGAWKIVAPAQADADRTKASQLLNNLGRLEAVEYVTESPKADDLGKLYGLDKPALQVLVKFSDAAKPALKLLLGKQREGKPDYFAKLDGSPGVFVVGKEIHDTIDQGSLTFRPLQLWQVFSQDVASIRIQKEGKDEYTLTRKGNEWRITGPFDAAAMSIFAQPMAEELAGPRCERYETASADDLAKYGLDKPYLRVTLTTAARAGEAEKPVERIVLIGKPTDLDAKLHYAKLGDEKEKTVFVVGERLVSALDRAALDLLDRRLLAIAPSALLSIESKGSEAPLTLEYKDNAWQVTQSPAGTFTPDLLGITGATRVWANLAAQRFVAYGPKADLAKYGLDKPSMSVTVAVEGMAAADGKKPELVKHTLFLGKPVEGAAGERYARLDDQPGVAVLSAPVVAELTRTYLDFVERTVLTLDASKVNAVVRKMGNETLELSKNDDGWQIVKPAATRGDDDRLQGLLEQLANLRASRVAAYPAKDLKEFGLDVPAAEITLRAPGADGKRTDRVLKLGKTIEGSHGDRYAMVEGGQTVYVLPAGLAERLTGTPFTFRNRNLARFADADKIILERGTRKATFTKVDGTWKMTDPVEAEAEHAELEEFLFGKDGLAKLQADELVAEKPADLKPFGLDKPAARWHVHAGDKEVMNLAIGNREQANARAYAQLAGNDLVFLLKPKLSTQVLAEYRQRPVWTVAPDAAQVEMMRFGYAANPFTLEKVGPGWLVADKQELKVNTRAVNDALAALAGLKIDHYAVDKGADLALYGLDKPQLILEVQTPTGKRVLHIGRPEGESKRYYALTPDRNKDAVFVLSEVDCAKIVRDLAGFTQK
jgi:hypothetical protein